MRFPFLKLSSKRHPETGSSLVTPPRVGVNAPQTGTPLTATPSPSSVSPAEGVAPSVPLRLGSILSQLPSQLFLVRNKNELASVVISIPGNLVLPQLASGKIAVRLAELVKLIPSDLLRQPLTMASDQQSIVLPLAEVIASIPAETLAVPHESVIATDTPEFNALPNLFDDSLVQEQAATREETATEDSAVEETPHVEPATPEPVVPAAVPVTASIDSSRGALPPAPATDAPEQVAISLRSLIAVLPDRVFSCPRTELWRKADFDSRVRIPVEPILPQLKTARLELPLSDAIALVPPALLANPLPETKGETVRMPLEEIVPQLPSRLFTAELSLSDAQEFELADADIPAPFQEKGVEAGGLGQDVEIQPAEVPVEEVALEEEGLEIFAEKTAPVEVPRVEPLEVSPPASPQEAVPPVEAIAPPTVETVAAAAPPVVPEIVESAAPVEPVEPSPQLSIEEIQVHPQPTAEKVPPVSDDTQIIPQLAAEEVQPPAEQTQPVPQPAAEQKAEAETVPAPAEPLSPSEVDQGSLDRYLINLNRCAVEDLQTIQGIGPALAKRIIEFRDARGHFSSLDELRQIPGIGRKTFRALTGVEPRALNRLLGADHNRELSLQEIVHLTNALPGITGCMLAMSDGLFLTGELPPQFDRETISVFAPQLFKKVGRYTRELRVGQIRRFTIFTDQQPLSIFRAGDVYLIVIHNTRHFSKALLRRCERISQEIARLCRQRAVV